MFNQFAKKRSGPHTTNCKNIFYSGPHKNKVRNYSLKITKCFTEFFIFLHHLIYWIFHYSIHQILLNFSESNVCSKMTILFHFATNYDFLKLTCEPYHFFERLRSIKNIQRTRLQGFSALAHFFHTYLSFDIGYGTHADPDINNTHPAHNKDYYIRYVIYTVR
jgi:hypothetical protein